jgi:hypothetical protein
MNEPMSRPHEHDMDKNLSKTPLHDSKSAFYSKLAAHVLTAHEFPTEEVIYLWDTLLPTVVLGLEKLCQETQAPVPMALTAEKSHPVNPVNWMGNWSIIHPGSPISLSTQPKTQQTRVFVSI